MRKKKTLYQTLGGEMRKSYPKKTNKGGTLTSAKLAELYNSIEKSKDIPTHYWDSDGIHKI